MVNVSELEQIEITQSSANNNQRDRTQNQFNYTLPSHSLACSPIPRGCVFFLNQTLYSWSYIKIISNKLTQTLNFCVCTSLGIHSQAQYERYVKD